VETVYGYRVPLGRILPHQSRQELVLQYSEYVVFDPDKIAIRKRGFMTQFTY
jgi:hypothetical protein